MKDLEIPGRYLPIQDELNYHKIDGQTLRSDSRGEDIIFEEKIIPKLRGKGFPIYSTDYVLRSQISSNDTGIAAAMLLLESEGFHEQKGGEHEIYPCTGGAMESDFRE